MLTKGLLISLLVLSLSACNTWAGFGRDLQQLGKKIEDKSGS
jgi:predicted small secreted protein